MKNACQDAASQVLTLSSLKRDKNNNSLITYSVVFSFISYSHLKGIRKIEFLPSDSLLPTGPPAPLGGPVFSRRVVS